MKKMDNINLVCQKETVGGPPATMYIWCSLQGKGSKNSCFQRYVDIITISPLDTPVLILVVSAMLRDFEDLKLQKFKGR